MKTLLDTSVLIGAEHGRVLAADVVPEVAAISVVTLAELRIGVLNAPDHETRAARMRTLSVAERLFDPLPVDVEVAGVYAKVQAQLARDRKGIGVHDALIAATAIEHGATLLTQDRAFNQVEGLDVEFV